MKIDSNKTLLLASFIFQSKLELFLKHIENNFNIKRKDVSFYKNETNDGKIIVVFKLVTPEYERINFKEISPTTIPIHKKGSTLYTINALNKVIEQNNQELIGNIDYKSIKIDWDLFNNKFILINDTGLTILSITKIFL